MIKDPQLEKALVRIGLNPNASIFDKNEELDSREWVAALYCRVSNEERDETIETQEKYLRNYAKEKKFTVYDVYKDVDTGSYNLRQDYMRLVDDVYRGKVNLVLVRTLDRFTRETSEIDEKILKSFKVKGVRFIATADKIDSLLKDDEKIRMKAWSSEQFLRDCSDKTREALKEIAFEGFYIGSKPPYGYVMYNTGKHNLLVRANDGSAEIIEEIFDLYLGGTSFGGIAKTLIDKGVPPPLKKWNANTIKNILTNEKYCGLMVQGKWEKQDHRKYCKSIKVEKNKWITSENTFQGIITINKYIEVQDIMESRKPKRFKLKKDEHIFSGIFICGDCGSTMHFRKNCQGYKCGNSQLSKIAKKSECTTHFTKEELLTNIIKECMMNKLSCVDKQMVINKSKQYYLSLSNSIDASLKNSQKEIKRYSKRILELYTDFKDGRITELVYNITSEELEYKFNKATIQKQLLERKKSEIDQGIKHIEYIVDEVISMKFFDRQYAVRLIGFIKTYENESLKIKYNFRNPLIS